jgi:sugar/nucleoside kinase (ribokinase family)
LSAETTSSFPLHYHGDDRDMRVEAIGPVWEPADIAAARVDSRWVHIAPLLRSDFPVDALRRLAADGCLVSFDGQGLARSPRLGTLTLDAEFDPAVLASIQVLKLADDEVDALIGGEFAVAAARRFGIPEILVTHGSGGSDLYVDGAHIAVPATWRVPDVQATGAGDMFSVSYVAGRAVGHEPEQAAADAARFVAEQLELRRRTAAQ